MIKEFIGLFADCLEKEPSEVKDTDIFRNYEEWDSLAFLSVLAMINENFDITIPREKFDDLKTVSDLYNKIMEIERIYE